MGVPSPPKSTDFGDQTWESVTRRGYKVLIRDCDRVPLAACDTNAHVDVRVHLARVGRRKDRVTTRDVITAFDTRNLGSSGGRLLKSLKHVEQFIVHIRMMPWTVSAPD